MLALQDINSLAPQTRAVAPEPKIRLRL